MKHLFDLTEAPSGLPEIYCDLDQVLVAFIKGAEKALGGDFATMDKEDRSNKKLLGRLGLDAWC